MSTTALPGNLSPSDKANSQNDAIAASVRGYLEILGSMKLTCVLFLMGMFVVFVGSLAQARRDVWLVVGEYFRTYLAWIDVADFFPPSMFPSLVNYDWSSLGMLRHIPFPGGWTIGWIMLANLVAAHFLRFNIRVTGFRMNLGLGIMAIGAVITFFVVWTGNGQTGVEYGDSILSPLKIWYLMLGILGIAAAASIGVAVKDSGLSKPERVMWLSIGCVLGGVLLYFVIGGEEARLNLSSMRILWQLLKGLACALVLLIGCTALFEKRGGIMLIHIGVALLMFSELQVGFYAKENLLALQEGQRLSYMRDTREIELAIVNREDGKDRVVAIPQSQIMQASDASDPAYKIIDDDKLPFKLRVEGKFLRNCRLRSIMPGDDKQATAGLGTFAIPVELDPITGMDDSHDMGALRITVLDSESGKEIETLLCAQGVSEMRSVPIAEQATVDGKDYQFYLRFQRNYKDYEVELLDVSRTNYVGTSTPRDYRSRIIIHDNETGDAEEYALWMNNPLRYKGETFYQSGYNELPDGTEMTTLSVVRNTGWMLPYIACMIVAVGMFAQFGLTLGRYLSRFDRPEPTSDGEEPDTTDEDDSSPKASALPAGIRAAAKSPAKAYDLSAGEPETTIWPVVVPILIVALSAGWLLSKTRTPKDNPDVMNLYSFAQVPVAWKGRAQPIDSFARTELLMTSHKSTFKGELSEAELNQPKTREALIKTITKYWPSVKENDLGDFNGNYSQWIERVMKLTASGREAVEERLRGNMIGRMSAVRWFLDVVARPEEARRHRIIKIEDDQVLSLLDLEKRAGLAYSVEEIQKNLSELETINREGLKLEMAEQQHRMSQLQRRVVALFRTVGRVDSMQNIFLVRESESLLDSMVKSWWVLKRLGNSPAIMAVPTGSENEQRSWETMIAASALRNVITEFRAAGIKNRHDVLEYMNERLPQDLLLKAIQDNTAILSANEAIEHIPDARLPEVVRKRAKEICEAESKAAENEKTLRPFLVDVLKLMADASEDATPEQIVASVPAAEAQRMTAESISADLASVFEELSQDPSDKRLAAMRTRLRGFLNTDESVLGAKMNEELANIALDDLDDRVGQLIYGGKGSEALEKGAESMVGILTAWRESDVKAFNENVTEYRDYLATNPLPHVDAAIVSEEAFFNFFEPFMKAIYLYLPVLLLSFFSWIIWSKTLRRTAFWLMMLAFVIHTAALLLRMHISGRPPVTNLYSSAIFIGWAVVGSSFVIERLLKNGIGNILGSSVGMGTLMIAHYLARDEGDTMGVMQAVLDTTFWLATHVVCITLGYAATFLAGTMAIAYCVMSIFSPNKSSKDLASLGKMIYGVLCFALFFSLVGTVLGGLWADDSWGRFWGWDPKENGAMLIVMWNAVILHARWDKMVRDYGTAVLAIFGNVVTAWSWFGVNELKAGLHTYGFTEGRLLALGVFIAVQMIIIAGALIPVVGKSANDKIKPA